MKITDFKTGDKVVRVKPTRVIGDRSYIGEELILTEIANGMAYFEREEGEELTLELDEYSNDWELWVEVKLKYVEAIVNEYNKNLTTGRIYPVYSVYCKYYRVDDVKDIDGHLLGVHIKPSTKEAYEAQEIKKQDPIITGASKLRGRLIKKRIAELEKENKRLNDVANSANKQAALVMEENKQLIDKMKSIKKLAQ